MKPIPTEEAGKKIRETPVEKLREQRRAKKRNPTGRRIRRDGWLSPLTLEPNKLSSNPQAHRKGVRSSDRGFLNVRWEDYWALLKWTAKQTHKRMEQIPARLAKRLSEIGIDASMWRDMVWDWQRYFGKTACIGSPEAMKDHASQTGLHHHRGQARLRECFTG